MIYPFVLVLWTNCASYCGEREVRWWLWSMTRTVLIGLNRLAVTLKRCDEVRYNVPCDVLMYEISVTQMWRYSLGIVKPPIDECVFILP